MYTIGIYGKSKVGKTRVVAALMDIKYENKNTIDIHAHAFEQLTILDLPDNLTKLDRYSVDKMYIVINGNYALHHTDLEIIHKVRKMHIPFEFLICFGSSYMNDILSELPVNIPVHILTSQREIKKFKRLLEKMSEEKIAEHAMNLEKLHAEEMDALKELDRLNNIDTDIKSEHASEQSDNEIIADDDNTAEDLEYYAQTDVKIDENAHEVIKPKWVIIGKENAGKSTLFNAMLGYERNVVSDIPGTTQASVIEQYHDTTIKDTAGIKRMNNDYIYRFLEKGSIILFMIDAVIGLTAQDKKLLTRIQDSGLGCIICVNKVDLEMKNDLLELIKYYYPNIPCLSISAKLKRGLGKLNQEMQSLEQRLQHKFPTRVLNNWLRDIKSTLHLIKIKYMRQDSITPYSFTCFTTPAILTVSQMSYIRNLIYKTYPLQGICFQLHLKAARSVERAQKKPDKFKNKKLK